MPPARAPINGATLRWAREVALVGKDELARAASINEHRVTEFENGDTRPTLKQLEAIAKKLDRTPAFFFTEPPAEPDVPEAVDFRSGNGEPPPSHLAREMRRAEQHRETVIDLEGTPPSPALVEPINRHNATARARELRGLLDLSESSTPPGNGDTQTLGFWRTLLERHGYLVFQTTRVQLGVFRGLSIHHDVLPIILLNGADSNNGKVFTLFHEVAHLANRTSGMCALDDDVNEEAVANMFAANFLMPDAQVSRLASTVSGTATERAEEIAKALKVSSLAAGVRLRTLDLITDEELESVRRDSDRRWAQARESQKKSPGGPPSWQIRYRNLGPGYVGTIAHALEDERVDLLDASHLLYARVPDVQRMIDEYYRTEALT
ncbi:ImmA/IrrE family metallo-endopeptidase [Actinomyces lilanjuaniae]|uniref:ImmA/IrrE family metallo-endopeptidase n=1 Tax=Actinomyces lilanjuaniae TaxID=2321394 RepID=A0ABM6Z0X8_9ACTO|nr:XRE family transcriptional regulator [Actinomyces lilanjuaniae]AYD88906.1 ImmA/IrrE family metallo-endopeptidase [Actinomyces lilanjuaniae]